MYQPKLVIYALTLEATAIAALVIGEGSDSVLAGYLLAHAGASAILSLIAVAFLPKHLSTPRTLVLLFLFSISYAVPILGIAAVIFIVFFLNALRLTRREQPFQAITLPQVDMHQRASAGFRQAGMRAFISNARAPVATRLRALVALQNVSGHVSSPLLRDVLTDPSEDIRLLAYGMLDNKEKRLNNVIHTESLRFRAAETGSPEHTDSASKLADLYWEMVYQELAQGDLRQHALEQSLHYIGLALTRMPDDASLHLRQGRLLHSLHQPQAANAAYDRALALGMPKTRIIPYLAEVAYDLGNYAEVHNLMRELGDWQSLPRLKSVIAYWSRA